MEKWRLLDTPPLTAAENMALDDTLLEMKGKGETPNTIHFLRFSPRAVLLGFHQSVEEEVRTGYCHTQNIHINRRITGGGAIFFDESQLGWEVICEKSFFNVAIPHGRLFQILCEPVITALDILGLTASFRPRNDLEINGRKISGTGGSESDNAFLFQGTMLTDFDVDTMLKALRIPVEKLKAKEVDSVKERVTCLTWELGYTPEIEEIKQAIRIGFEKGFGIKLEPGHLTAEEQKLFKEKLGYYRSDEWIHMVNPAFNRHEVAQAAYKADGGMVRFTLVVDIHQKKLKDLYITGDFLSFPSRALFDLEARLRGKSLDRDEIHCVITQFFDGGNIRIPGVSCEDLLKPLDQALAKIDMTRYGIPLEYCNQISVVNGSFEEVIAKEPSVLLLPYCSKLTTCDLRYQKECRVCEGCSVGYSWQIGRRRGMEVICVVSFEDLMAELKKMKAAGIPAFVGCCCEPFFIKHFDDLEQAGIPGLLLHIDNATCYDLDQTKEAYAGAFASQTELNLSLLRTVLNVRAGYKL